MIVKYKCSSCGMVLRVEYADGETVPNSMKCICYRRAHREGYHPTKNARWRMKQNFKKRG